MQQFQLESGLLRGFRVVIVYFIAFWVLHSPIFEWRSGETSAVTVELRLLLVGLISLGLLMLSAPIFPGRLGRFFLPVVIGMCTMPFLVERIWFINTVDGPDVSESILFHVWWIRQDMILLLLIVAWQYRLRVVIFYTILVGLAEWWLIWQSNLLDSFTFNRTTDELVTRMIVWLIAGYSMTWLMGRQRAQRRALIEANEQQVEANAKLADFASTVEQLSVTRERNRLARELHDTLAHSLSAASVQIEAIHSLWAVDEVRAQAMLISVDDTVRTGLKEARRSLQALRASPLDEVGLFFALRDAAESAAKRGDFTLHLGIPEDVVHLPDQIEQALYRIGQEALENVIRHARARNVWLQITHSARSIGLKVRDDGLGFDSDMPPDQEHQLGIRGMRERAAMLDGKLAIVGQPGRGTTVYLEVALNQCSEDRTPNGTCHNL